LTADADDRSAERDHQGRKTAYVLNFAAASGAPEGSVTPINTATNTAAREIIVGMNPSAIAITAQAR
jgi:YVTN family beta-propeller protein